LRGVGEEVAAGDEGQGLAAGGVGAAGDDDGPPQRVHAADDEGRQQSVGQKARPAADACGAGGVAAATANPLGHAQRLGRGHRRPPVVVVVLRARRRSRRGAASPVAILRESRKLITPMPTISRNSRMATADASPRLRRKKAISHRNRTVVWNWRSLPPMPPAVETSNRRGSAKICRPPIVAVITTKMRVGRIVGMVIEKKRRTGPAPSIAADS